MATLGFCTQAGGVLRISQSRNVNHKQAESFARRSVVRSTLVTTRPETTTSVQKAVKGGGLGPLNDDILELPMEYDIDAIAKYWNRRPLQVQRRLWQVSTILMPYIITTVMDKRFGSTLTEAQKKQRAVQLRVLLTKLGPAFIKLGQGLSVRPDLVGPEVMTELQQLCDQVPPFDNDVAMAMIEEELGKPVSEMYTEISSEPIAAASLGQVYRGRLRTTGEEVAVKVQRPDMIRRVSLDLYVMRKLFKAVQVMQDTVSNAQTEFIPLFDQWASGTYRELDYVNEGKNAVKFYELIKSRTTGVVVPEVKFEATSRKVITTEWINGQKLADMPQDEVKDIVGLGVQCFLTQLLDTGFFHADPHPGNLMVNENRDLVVLDFGLMSEVREGQSDVFVAAIIHLGNRDYEAVVDDFIKLDFLEDTVDRSKVVPVLGAVLDQALEGGGAKSINFQTLSSELSQITFDFPFKIPPYAALVIRALGVLEGIALVADPQFKMIMEAFPYVSKRVMSTDTPLLRKAFRDIVYKDGKFSAKRLQVLLDSSAGFLGEGDAFVDFDTPSSDPIDPQKSFEFLASDDGAFIRSILADEIATSVSVLAKSSATSLKSFLPLPVRALPGLSQILNQIPDLTDEELQQLLNVQEIVRFLASRQKNGGTQLTAVTLREMLPSLGRASSEITLMVAGQLSENAVKSAFERRRSNGTVVAGRRRVSRRTLRGERR